LIEFFKQRFNVMEKVTGIPGEHTSRKQTLDGVEAIIGKIDGPNEAIEPEEQQDTVEEKDKSGAE